MLKFRAKQASKYRIKVNWTYPESRPLGPQSMATQLSRQLNLIGFRRRGCSIFLKKRFPLLPFYGPFLLLNNKESSYLLSQPWTCLFASNTSFICCDAFSTKMLIASSDFVSPCSSASNLSSHMLIVFSQFVPVGMVVAIVSTAGRCSFHIHHQNFKKISVHWGRCLGVPLRVV